MAKRGGKRQGSGRKPNPVKDARVGAQKAQQLLKELDAEKSLKEVFKTCGDPRLKVLIIFKLFEHGFGKPADNTEITGKGGGPLQIQLVNHIPRPKKK